MSRLKKASEQKPFEIIKLTYTKRRRIYVYLNLIAFCSCFISRSLWFDTTLSED